MRSPYRRRDSGPGLSRTSGSDQFREMEGWHGVASVVVINYACKYIRFSYINDATYTGIAEAFSTSPIHKKWLGVKTPAHYTEKR